MLSNGSFLIDRYEILDRIGAGGMAEVYKAKDTVLNRFVAIKALKTEYCSDETFVRKFKVEAQSAAGLSHPNIVSVFDVAEENDMYYIIMELVEGITLKNYIDMKGRLDIKEALNISVQIAQGLSAAHANRIIHRDIKPQNIIISRDGKVKVTDFGIARMADSDTVTTTTAAGTVSYISPEQARGGYSDEKSDIYSLGITMYEMLTGELPYAGETNVAVALMHIQGEMTPPRELEASIPKSFEKVILKCTQKKPEWRYPSVKDLITDLRKVLTDPEGDYVNIPGMNVVSGSTITMSPEEISKLRSSEEKDSDSPEEAKVSESGNLQAEEVAILNGDEHAIAAEPEDPAVAAVPPQSQTLSREDEEKLLDEEEDEVDDHMGKILMTMGIAGFVILIIILAVLGAYITGLIGGGLSLFGGGDKESETSTAIESQSTEIQTAETAYTTESEEATSAMVTVPNLLGKTEDEAVKILSDSRLEVEVKESTSDDYAVGQVCEQSEEPGESVEAHTIVTIYVCKGTQSFRLENVRGINYERASTMLKSYGLNVKIKFVDDNSMGVDEVAYTEPEIGSSVVEGDTITLFVCQGQSTENVRVPDVRGKDLDTAISELEEAGLTYNGKSSDYSDTYSEGQVIDQSIAGDKYVEKGSTVSLTVSLGSKVSTYKADIRVPSPFDGSVTDDYGERVEEGYLEIIVEKEGSSDTIYEEYVDSSSIPATLSDDSTSSGAATVSAYINGKLYDSWTVNYE